jgi:hypothetical protein
LALISTTVEQIDRLLGLARLLNFEEGPRS